MIKFGVFLLAVVACSASPMPPCVCTRDYRPVCGSNGKTYANPCLLKCARVADNDLTMIHPGTCDQAPTSCVCTFEYKPVCGSDGTTYPNYCSLGCQRSGNPLLEPRYDGPCRSEDKQEPGMPPCVCTREKKQVCGTDGVTYSNACMLKCYAQTRRDLKVKSNGPCVDVVKVAELPLPSRCACTRELHPVCGTDGVTYNNPCLLNCVARNMPLAMRAEGPCDDAYAVKVVEQPRPSSNCACSRNYMPVCGSDGKTYSNPCMLGCSKEKSPKLKLAHVGPCDGEGVKVGEVY